MPGRIESILMEKFKGATNRVAIDFDTSKPVVMIFGENGTGKSTIVDAIDFVYNENFGSIDQRSTTGSKADLLASLGSPADNLKADRKAAFYA
jgi:DNA repair exonuclease SbcCD ATPase subunit